MRTLSLLTVAIGLLARGGIPHNSQAQDITSWVSPEFSESPKSAGADQKQPAAVVPDPRPLGAECGLYAVIAAVKAMGRDFDPEEILLGSYLSQEWGSSGTDLCRAISDVGAYALPMRGIGLTALRQSGHPLILNLIDRQALKCPGHWITYLGDDGGQALVYDANASPRVMRMNYGELLSSLSGDGIAVLNQPSTWRDHLVLYLQRMEYVWPLLLLWFLGGSILNTDSLKARFRYTLTPAILVQALGLLALAIGWAVFDQGFAKHGLMAEPEMLGWIQSKYTYDRQLPQVGYRQLETLRHRSDVTVVDCRPRAAFEYGHIPGAVNVPIDARPGEFFQDVRQIPKRNAIIAYCNSEPCDWADIVGQRLKAQGIRQVFVFRQGLAGYIEERTRKAALRRAQPQTTTGTPLPLPAVANEPTRTAIPCASAEPSQEKEAVPD